MTQLTLADIYVKRCRTRRRRFGSDKGSWHSYIEFYEEILAPFRLKAQRVLEIGIKTGHSLLMWKDYFPNAEIIGVDIACHNGLDPDQFTLIYADSRVPEEFENINNLDIVIDDGSHRLRDQARTFNVFWPKVVSGGLYVIEDIHRIEYIPRLMPLHQSAVAHDRRSIKGRSDDILMTFYKP